MAALLAISFRRAGTPAEAASPHKKSGPPSFGEKRLLVEYLRALPAIEMLVLLARASSVALLAYGALLCAAHLDVLDDDPGKVPARSARSSRLVPHPVMRLGGPIAAAVTCVIVVSLIAIFR